MEDQPWFKDWFNSPYYHQLYFNRDEEEAAAFIDKLIDYLKTCPRCINAGCGLWQRKTFDSSCRKRI